MKKFRIIILLGFVLGALVPTPIYFFSLWYYEFITTKELVGLFTSLKPWMIFVAIYYPMLVIYLSKKLSIISDYLQNKNSYDVERVQKTISFLPKFYIVNIMMYATLGASFAVIPEGFLNTFEKSTSIVLGFAFVFVYTIPFFIYTIKLLEKWTRTIPLSDEFKFISIKYKLSVNILGMMIGIFILIFTLNLGVIMANSNCSTEVLLEILLSKNIVLGILCGSIIIINYIMTTIQLVDPIVKTTDMFKSISQGDLTKRIEINSRDEIGVLKKWCDDFVEKTHRIVSDVRKGAKELNLSSESLTTNINDIVSSIEVMGKKGEEISTSAESTSKTIEEVTHSLTNIDKSINTILDNSVVANNQGDKTIEISKQGKIIVNDAIEKMNFIYKMVNNLLEIIQNLSNGVEKIDNITKVIEEISNETNLLALNASIESARAGEHGRGFAVVASSINELSKKSSESTSEIEKLIQDIQKDTINAVNTATKDITELKKGIEEIGILEDSFDNIHIAIEDTTKLITQISSSTNKHVKESNAVMGFVSNINEMAVVVSEMVEKQVTDIDTALKSLEKISTLTKHYDNDEISTVNKLNKQAKKLYDVVANFKVE